MRTLERDNPSLAIIFLIRHSSAKRCILKKGRHGFSNIDHMISADESEIERKMKESSRMWQHLWKSLHRVGGGERSEIVQISGRAWFQWSGHVFFREGEKERGAMMMREKGGGKKWKLQEHLWMLTYTLLNCFTFFWKKVFLKKYCWVEYPWIIIPRSLMSILVNKSTCDITYTWIMSWSRGQ